MEQMLQQGSKTTRHHRVIGGDKVWEWAVAVVVKIRARYCRSGHDRPSPLTPLKELVSIAMISEGLGSRSSWGPI